MTFYNASRHSGIKVIKSFPDKETERFYITKVSRKFASVIQTAKEKLDYLDSATKLEDLKAPPGNRLEKLKGNYEGKWSIRINDQFRIVFEWRGSDAYGVKITDYH